MFLTLGTVEKPADRVFTRFAGFRDSKFPRIPLRCRKSVYIRDEKSVVENSNNRYNIEKKTNMDC